jgi:putative flippase GtrA
MKGNAMEIFRKKIRDARNNRDFIELIKFSIVGVSNTLIDFLVYSFLIYMTTIKPEIIQAFSYTVGTINSFIFNKKWTFKTERNKNNKLQALRFIIINAFSLILSSASIRYLIEELSVHKIIAKILVVLLTQFINYLGYKLLVFK